MYLADWMGFLPVEEVHALPTGRKPFQPAIGLGYPRGYPDLGGGKDIRVLWRVSAGTGEYLPADSRYPQQIIPSHLYWDWISLHNSSSPINWDQIRDLSNPDTRTPGIGAHFDPIQESD
jgi:hypothetical protein